MALTNKERLILNDSIDDVDVFLTDMAEVPDFDLTEFIEFKTKLIKEKYNISDAELTIAFLENIDIANEAGKALRKSIEYIGLRKARYAERNQDEMRYDDAKNGTNLWVEWQDQIRLDIPKPV
jgi:hypothetical protein